MTFWSAAGPEVEENHVQVQISGLRRVLGLLAIATTPGPGYRLTMNVLRIMADATGHDHEAAGPAGPPASDTPLCRAGNLPEVLPPQYGRDAEHAQLCAMLEIHPTAATLAGGGVGDTHLARTLAGSRRPFHADGLWRVDVAELPRSDHVAPMVAQTQGFHRA